MWWEQLKITAQEIVVNYAYNNTTYKYRECTEVATTTDDVAE